MSFLRATLKADGLLLLVAVIWGFSFVAQRSGMTSIGPFAFNATRYAIGAVCLLPLLIRARLKATEPPRFPVWLRVLWATLSGAVLFLGATFQQVGLVTTTAGNAGFITCLYVVLVPIAGMFLGRKTGWRIWIGALLALVGLYIISVGGSFHLAPGDLLELIGAFFWTGQILLISYLGSRMEALELSVGQFVACALFSLVAALWKEPQPFAGVMPALIPILYGGFLSSGVAFPLQIVAQRTAHPSHAAIIYALEALFAALGGVLVLGEPVTARLVVGGLMMFAGMICSQLQPAESR